MLLFINEQLLDTMLENNKCAHFENTQPFMPFVSSAPKKSLLPFTRQVEKLQLISIVEEYEKIDPESLLPELMIPD
jgi:hypothetical protein